MITITSKQPGFRRCGIAHPGVATDYPDGHWTPKQLATLRAEPMLLVRETLAPGSPPPSPRQQAEALTVKELTAKLLELQREPPANAKKGELVELYLSSLNSQE
jgi:hypothetical protein